MSNELVQLHNLLNKHFSLDELKLLCFTLEIEFDNLSGDTRSEKARQLILEIGKKSRFRELLIQMQSERPTIFNTDDFRLTKTTILHLEEGLSTYTARSRPILEQVRDNQALSFTMLAIVLIGSIVIMVLLLLNTSRIQTLLTSSQPVPGNMPNGSFNVAVAEIQVQDMDGNPIESRQGKALGEQIYSTLLNDLESELQQGSVPITYEVWAPESTGIILDDEQAKWRASNINATVLIHGIITKTEDDLLLYHPQFYVNASGFAHGQEVAGQHSFGQAILFADEGEFNTNTNLKSQISALAFSVIGLSYFAENNNIAARNFFQQAQNISPSDVGNDILYLLIGNTYLQEASTVSIDRNLASAQEYYDLALSVECNFEVCATSRAMVGKAIILYREALGDLSTINSYDEFDLEKLEEAKAIYNDLLSRESLPEGANIRTKAHLGLAQIEWATALKLGTSFQSARDNLVIVLKDYECGNSLVKEQAQLSYSILGAISGNDDEHFIRFYENAVALASDSQSSDAYYQLGDAHLHNDTTDLACEAFSQCIAWSQTTNDLIQQEICTELATNLCGSEPFDTNQLPARIEFVPIFFNEASC